MSYHLLVCGGRDYKDAKALRRVLDKLPAPGLVITGGAAGADTLADQWAEVRGYARVIFPANWTGEGKRAGYARNMRMLRVGQPDMVVAFPGGRGTEMMMMIAREAEDVRVVDVRELEIERMLS